MSLPRASSLPILQAIQASRDPESFFAACENAQGDPFCVALPGAGPIYLTGHPDGAKEIFRAPPESFEPLLPNPVEPLLGPGSLILQSGRRHKRERKLLTPPFHGQRMKAYAQLMEQLATDQARDLVSGQRIDARDLARKLTLLVIVHAIFGVSDANRVERVIDAIERTTERYSGPLALVPATRLSMFGLSPWDRFSSAAAHLDAVLREEIERKRGQPPGDDILSLLLSLRYEDGEPMEPSDLLDELKTMLVAGHETASTSLAWALGYVHADARVEARLRGELSAGDGPYLGAVCSESLRRHPAVPIVLRKLRAPMTFRGHELEAGSTVGISLTQLHTRPETWERPLEFYPEHFLNTRYTPFEYAPFGGGHRRCIGAAFATFELKILLGTLLRKRRFALVGSLPSPVTRSITMSPGGPITLVVDS